MKTANYSINTINLIPILEKDTAMKILIVDDFEMIANRIQKLITHTIDSTKDTVEIINNLDNLLVDIYHKAPDILLLNTYSVRGTLIETIRAIKTIRPQTQIICLTEFIDSTFEKILKGAGADYFLDIASSNNTIPEIITKLKHRFL